LVGLLLLREIPGASSSPISARNSAKDVSLSELSVLAWTDGCCGGDRDRWKGLIPLRGGEDVFGADENLVITGSSYMLTTWRRGVLLPVTEFDDSRLDMILVRSDGEGAGADAGELLLLML